MLRLTSRDPRQQRERRKERKRECVYERERERLSFFSRRKWKRAPTYLRMQCARATTLLHSSTSSSRSRRFRCYRGAGRRDNATLRGSRRGVLSHSHSCYSPRGPSLAVILEAKYEVHTSSMYISLFLIVAVSFSLSFSHHHDLLRYILVSYKIPTGKDSLCRAFIHESHELWLS